MNAVVLIVLALVAFAVYEVRADRKVRRSTAGASPVVIVRGLKPRWWRGLSRKAGGWLVQGAVLLGLLLLALHMRKTAPADVNNRWPMPGSTSPAAPASPSTGHPAAHAATSSKPSTPKGH